ncbi:MAG: M16 family metallopeptidase [Bacteroidota bacterium]|jgi:zinc protease
MLVRNSAPQFESIKKIDLIKANKIELKNGVSLYVINAGEQDLCKVEVLFYAGTKYQQQALVASYANKLCIEGTSKKTSEQISEEIDFYGSYLETECNSDWASLKIYALNKYLRPSLNVLCQIITDANFPKEEFDIHNQNTFQQFLTRNKKVSDVAAANFQEMLFGKDNFYGRKNTEADYSSITNEMVADFFNTNYSTQNMVVVASGKIEDNQIAEIQETLGSIVKEGKKNSLLNLSFQQPENFNHLIEKEDAVQSALRMGKPMFNKTHPKFAALQVVNTILGGYFGSRLMKNIREDKGYTYGIGSGLVSKVEGGYWVISSEVGSDVCGSALNETKKELSILCNELVSEEELSLVKNYMLGQHLKNCDGAFSLSDRFVGLLMYDLDYSYYDKYVKVINEITPQNILKLCQEYLNPDTFLQLVVGKNPQ